MTDWALDVNDELNKPGNAPIKELSDWVLDIECELNNRCDCQSQEEPSRKKRSIYKLPLLISDLNMNAYQPRVVSFGPYHHGEPHLMPMEDHKHRALLNFLHRSQVSLGTILNSMLKVAQDLKDFYDSLGPEWRADTKKFVKLMIVDGCFMLEILQAAAQQSWSDAGAQEIGSDYSRDDPIFGYYGKLCIMSFIRRDMLLLENQLPMLVLFKLQGIKENDKGDMETLNKLILKFYGHDRVPDMGKCLHILDLYRKNLVFEDLKPTKSPSRIGGKGTKNTIIRSATELTEAGIRFKKSESRSLISGISFRRGVLSLPTFVVDNTTESTFLNLIAFERCHVGIDHAFTSFFCFMSMIVHQDCDISLLRSKGIIRNFVSSDKAAADLFNMMSKDLIVDPSSHLNTVHEDIDFYCTNQ